MHHKGYIHRNISLTNISIGHGHNSNVIYLNDYKECRKFLTNGKHLSNNYNVEYERRNQMFATQSYLLNQQMSRRDDLEQLSLLLIYLLKGHLPWTHTVSAAAQSGHTSLDSEEMEGEILGMMDLGQLKTFCRGLPKEFFRLLEYSRGLAYDETPDYSYIKNIFSQLFMRQQFVTDGLFCWSANEEGNLEEENEINKIIEHSTQLERKGNTKLIKIDKDYIHQQLLHKSWQQQQKVIQTEESDRHDR